MEQTNLIMRDFFILLCCMFLNKLFYLGTLNRYYSRATKRLTNVERNSFSVPSQFHEVTIGLLLGDLYISKVATNARLESSQGLIHETYLLHLYGIFKHFCVLGPKIGVRSPDKRTGRIYSNIRFVTYSLPCFNSYHELFYVERGGVKRIPLNIGEHLTAVGLAYWAMDDGSKTNSGFVLCTDSYLLNEVELLIKVLKDNFDLNCNIHKVNGNYRIYINSDSMNKFRSLVTPYFHESMLYKVSVETKEEISTTLGTVIYAYDLEGFLVNTFSSARYAAKNFNCHHQTIMVYVKNEKFFQDKWILSITLKNKG